MRPSLTNSKITGKSKMDKLSQSSQAVLDAFRSSHTGQGCLAAAFRALADHVVPDDPQGAMHFTTEAIRLNKQAIRHRILDIATELAGEPTPITTETTDD